MKTVNLYEAKTQLSKLVAEAVRGEEIVIAKNGEPQVRLVPVRPYSRSDYFGMDRGLYRLPDDFDAPLDEFKEYM